MKEKSVIYLNGTPLSDLSAMPSITFDSHIDDDNIIGTLSQNRNCSFTATFKHPKMSHKKFVHNLIKLGYSKKASKRLAWYYNGKKIPYGNANNLIALGLFAR